MLDPTASRCGCCSRPRRWSSGRSPASCASGSRRASTTRASRSRSRSGSWSGTGTRTGRLRRGGRARPELDPGLASGERRLERDRDRALSAWLTGQPTLAASAAATKSLLAHALDDAVHGEADLGDAGAGDEVDRGAGVQRGRRRAGLGQAVATAPSRSRTSARPRSAPRGWSCRWPPRRARRHDTSYVPMPEDSSVTLPAPSKRVPSQCVVALRVVAMCDPPLRRRQVTCRESCTPVLPVGCRTAVAGRSAEWTGDHVLRRDRRLRDLPADRRAGSTRAWPRTRCCGPLYPEEDLGPAEERFLLFLVQYWGGPTTYSDNRGHPRLRMRHAPFAVTPEAKERWLMHFREGLDEVAADPGAGRAVLGLRHPRRAVHGQQLRRADRDQLSVRRTTRVKRRTIRTCASPAGPPSPPPQCSR